MYKNRYFTIIIVRLPQHYHPSNFFLTIINHHQVDCFTIKIRKSKIKYFILFYFRKQDKPNDIFMGIDVTTYRGSHIDNRITYNTISKLGIIISN